MPTAIRGSSGSPWSRGWSERDRQAVVRGTIFLIGVGLLRFGEIVCGLQIQASVPSLPLLNDSRRIAAAVAVHDTPWQGRAERERRSMAAVAGPRVRGSAHVAHPLDQHA